MAGFVSRCFLLWVAVGLLLPTVLGGVFIGSWMGDWLGFIWGGLHRVFFVHDAACIVNCVCHIWKTAVSLWGSRRPFLVQGLPAAH